MKLHTAELKALENRIHELGGPSVGTIHLQRKYDDLKSKDEETINKLVPSAVKLINHKLCISDCTRVVYKETGAVATVVYYKNKYYVYASNKLTMVFYDVESLSRFLIVSEDLVFKSSLEENSI